MLADAVVGDSRATTKIPLRQTGGDAMRLEGRAEAIAGLGVTQLCDGVGSLRGGLRPDQVLHVLEQDERAERVVGLAQDVRCRETAAWYLSKAAKHQSAAEYTPALRLPQFPRSSPGVTEARRLAAGVATCSSRRRRRSG